MYHVLIVDDERIIREGLSRHIPWDEMGISVAAVAASADEALEAVQKHSIDILVTDIRMPGKTGLELIETIIALGYTPQVILISSYNDFTYARQACMLDIVCDYILKPIDINAFQSAVRRAIERLRRHRIASSVTDTRDDMHLLEQLDQIRFDRQGFLQLLIEPTPEPALEMWNTVAQALRRSGCSLEGCIRFCSNLLLYTERVFQHTTLGFCPYLENMPRIHDQLFAVRDFDELSAAMNFHISEICKNASELALVCKSRLIVTAVAAAKKQCLNADFNLASLAEELNVTPNYLSMRFHDETGMPFTKYVTNLRIKKAKELLENPKYRVNQVAAMTGFSDEKYFIRVFKAEVGETPKKYQQNNHSVTKNSKGDEA